MCLELRPALASDLLNVFNWANDPIVRQGSFSTEPISLKVHSTWFHQKIKDENCIYLIMLIKDEPAGQIRFDKINDEYIISFGIDKHFRGKGLGTKILNSSEEYLYEKMNIRPLRLKGFVKKENIPSIMSFERNSYNKAIADEATHPDSFVFTKIRL